MAGGSNSQGLSSADFRQRAAVGTLKRSPDATVSPSNTDPIAQAYDDSRRLAALRAMNAQEKVSETEAIKAENERLKAVIEQRQLTEQAQPPGAPAPAADRWQEFVLAQIGGLQEQIAVARSDAQRAQTALLEERMSILTAELERSKGEKPEGDDFDRVSDVIRKARGITQMVTPETVVQTGYDPGLEKWRITLEAEREQRRIEAEERRWIAETERDLKREQVAGELAIKEKQALTEQRFLNETAPRFLAIAEQFVTTWMQRQTVVSAQVADPGVAAMPPPVAEADVRTPQAPVAPPPPDIKLLQCPQCGGSVPYRDWYPEIICPRCYTVMQNDQAPQQPTTNGTYHEEPEEFPAGMAQ